jgi:hypothetical protein
MLGNKVGKAVSCKGFAIFDGFVHSLMPQLVNVVFGHVFPLARILAANTSPPFTIPRSSHNVAQASRSASAVALPHANICSVV